MQIVPPNEVVVLISFELTLGELRGMMNLCIPFNAIERISSRLVGQQLGELRQTTRRRRKTSSDIGSSSTRPRSKWSSTLAETKISTSDLIGLRVGDIITTEKDVHRPLDVAVRDAPKFHASRARSRAARRSGSTLRRCPLNRSPP